ncbi:Fic family protein [Spongiibacter sp. KMU-158]|uniref:Fic family protein n=1 Tax=Spongiibacter pelagi TaxID=2760804 RepID=A0A927C2H3_9GAMM|nr:Fic family protein [Spongiibacter pelagi]
MTKYNDFSGRISLFHDFPLLPEDIPLAGYSALIQAHALRVPAPDFLSAIGTKHRLIDQGTWRFYTPRHRPEDTLLGHLTFALKYEGLDLGILSALFRSIEPGEITEIVQNEPTGSYSRRIWFLFEWLTDIELPLEDAKRGNFVELVSEKLQYPGPPRDSRRHRVRNNLPGTRVFCPLIRRTAKLDALISENLSKVATEQTGKTHGDLLSRAAAFLLLKDSKASYSIEGESPPHNRLERWGRVIGQAGQRKLSIDELEALQEAVIPDHRFVIPGLRFEGGFVGEHDRVTGMPLPDHISARAEDLESLIGGMIEAYELLLESDYDPVLAATLIAFGFVFIHPFEDGNGRIHRYLIHHVLAETGFVPKGLVFPVSAVILERIEAYREALEHFSKRRLDLIEWRPTGKNNVEVLNETAELYRFFDATAQAEFLYDCVAETVNVTLPEEVNYLNRYDQLNTFIKNYLDMPDRMVDLLIRFLHQNGGLFSKRAMEKEFAALAEAERHAIEQRYKAIFGGDAE